MGGKRNICLLVSCPFVAIHPVYITTLKVQFLNTQKTSSFPRLRPQKSSCPESQRKPATGCSWDLVLSGCISQKYCGATVQRRYITTIMLRRSICMHVSYPSFFLVLLTRHYPRETIYFWCLEINYLWFPSLVFLKQKVKEYAWKKTWRYIVIAVNNMTHLECSFIHYGYIFQHCYHEFKTHCII